MKLGPLFANILVVDADVAFVRKVRLVLQSAGYAVRSAASGEAALETIAARPPDLILLKAHLPTISGYETARQVKANEAWPFIPILMLDQAGPENISAALNAGADEFLGLPLENAELLMRTRAALRLKVITDELAGLNEVLEKKVVERTLQLEQAHSKLRHAEKLSSLGRLAASLAHEINNPLSGLLNYVYLLKSDLPQTAEVQEDLHIMETQIHAIAKLVQQLRDFSKPPCKERRPIVLNQVIQQVLSLTGKELQKRHIRVQRSLAEDLPVVMASPEQMGEIFMNLIINAQDAMSGGGSLTLSTCADDCFVKARVVDTGAGIPADLLERIFEPFFTTKGERGTGLGLSICYSIAQDHGGQLSVESRVGEGTAFTLQIPVYS